MKLEKCALCGSKPQINAYGNPACFKKRCALYLYGWPPGAWNRLQRAIRKVSVATRAELAGWEKMYHESHGDHMATIELMNQIREVVGGGHGPLESVVAAVKSELTTLRKAARPGRVVGKCRWTKDADGVWSTGCGAWWTFETGGVRDNRVRYCHKCGKAVEVCEAEGGQK